MGATNKTMNKTAKSAITALLICAATSSFLNAESPFERELQQLKERHEEALNALLHRAIETADDPATTKIKKELAASIKGTTLKQVISDTRWAWFNSATFSGDKHWIEFSADGTARCAWGWPMTWAIEGPSTVFVRRTDTNDYFMHFNMDVAKLEGVADPLVTNSHDPRSIRFEKRVK